MSVHSPKPASTATKKAKTIKLFDGVVDNLMAGYDVPEPANAGTKAAE